MNSRDVMFAGDPDEDECSTFERNFDGVDSVLYNENSRTRIKEEVKIEKDPINSPIIVVEVYAI